jgi:hypothetical protein
MRFGTLVVDSPRAEVIVLRHFVTLPWPRDTAQGECDASSEIPVVSLRDLAVLVAIKRAFESCVRAVSHEHMFADESSAIPDEAPDRLRAPLGESGSPFECGQPDALGVSAATREGLDELRDAIQSAFEETLGPVELLVPYTDGARSSSSSRSRSLSWPRRRAPMVASGHPGGRATVRPADGGFVASARRGGGRYRRRSL